MDWEVEKVLQEKQDADEEELLNLQNEKSLQENNIIGKCHSCNFLNDINEEAKKINYLSPTFKYKCNKCGKWNGYETVHLTRKDRFERVKAGLDLSNEAITVSVNMIDCGGSFVNALGHALSHADNINVMKIKQAFPEYWEQYKNIENYKKE